MIWFDNLPHYINQIPLLQHHITIIITIIIKTGVDFHFPCSSQAISSWSLRAYTDWHVCEGEVDQSQVWLCLGLGQWCKGESLNVFCLPSSSGESWETSGGERAGSACLWTALQKFCSDLVLEKIAEKTEIDLHICRKYSLSIIPHNHSCPLSSWARGEYFPSSEHTLSSFVGPAQSFSLRDFKAFLLELSTRVWNREYSFGQKSD